MVWRLVAVACHSVKASLCVVGETEENIRSARPSFGGWADWRLACGGLGDSLSVPRVVALTAPVAAHARSGSWQNGLILPVLKHGPRSLTYMRVFGWQTHVRNESEGGLRPLR
jgi:hypothetical protein